MFIQLPDIVILAGGLGTRLKEEVDNLPKVMAPVNGKPFLEYLLDYIAKSGFQRVILSTGYMNHVIQDYFRDKYKSIEIVYSVEEEPLGTGGAVKKAFEQVHTPFFMVMNGDTVFRINLQKFFERHIELLANLSIALRPVDDSSRYGQVECLDDSTIIRFQEKSNESKPGLINGGIYIIKSKYFKKLQLPDKFSLENDLLQRNVDKDEFIGQVFDDYFLDIGIPQDYKRAQEEFNAFDDR
jgi:D-glycero-alpha-D-manno-heptose 1-phosphate guanylyltransferase